MFNGRISNQLIEDDLHQIKPNQQSRIDKKLINIAILLDTKRIYKAFNLSTKKEFTLNSEYLVSIKGNVQSKYRSIFSPSSLFARGKISEIRYRMTSSH